MERADLIGAYRDERHSSFVPLNVPTTNTMLKNPIRTIPRMKVMSGVQSFISLDKHLVSEHL